MHQLYTRDAPLNPNFVGSGWSYTDEAGHYEFIAIKPGNYSFRPSENR
ncbi:hypothetical protein [Suicoccus acidiformans]|nr:hypothetical protein [Suicoccus acidiformans]